MRHRLIAALVATLALCAAAILPANAIVGGRPDPSHREVAFILDYGPGGLESCSAVLVSPTVLLTAGHCVDGTVGRVAVSFEQVVAETPPPLFPQTADRSTGYQTEDITAADWLPGTGVVHPAYEPQSLDNDLGVVVLDAPVDIPPATLADPRTLNTVAVNRILFTVVGYGADRVKGSGPKKAKGSSPQKSVLTPFPLERRSALTQGLKVTRATLLTSNSGTNDTTGGICLGDSGGPVYADGEVVAIISYVQQDMCRGRAGSQRVDLAPVQEWLAAR